MKRVTVVIVCGEPEHQAFVNLTLKKEMEHSIYSTHSPRFLQWLERWMIPLPDPKKKMFFLSDWDILTAYQHLYHSLIQIHRTFTIIKILILVPYDCSNYIEHQDQQRKDAQELESKLLQLFKRTIPIKVCVEKDVKGESND